MIRILPALLVLPAVLALANPAVPPVAAQKPWSDRYHGQALADEYHWLQNRNDPAVLSYLKAENAYTEAATAAIAPLAKSLAAEITGRTTASDLTVPWRQGDFYYYARIDAGQQYPLNCRRRAAVDGSYDDSAPEHILLDQNRLAQGKKFFALEGMMPSPDGQLLAYRADTNGNHQFQLHVKDLRSGRELPLSVARVTSMEWAADNRTILLTQAHPSTLRPDRLLRVSTAGGKPVEVYRERDGNFLLGIGRTHDGRFLQLMALSSDTSDTWLLPRDQPTGALRLLMPRTTGHRYDADTHGDQLYLRTNRDAPNFRVVRAPLAAPQDWSEVMRPEAGTLIESLDVFRDFLVLSERASALSRPRILDFATGQWRSVQFDDEVYLLQQTGNAGYDDRSYRLQYQSPVAPPMVLEIDMASGARKVLKRQPLAGVDLQRFVTRRIWITARDGVKVPVWLAYRKDVKLDGSAPLLLYGYGGWGFPSEADFSLRRLSLMERGVIYAEAQIRGGNDLGEQWHDDGKLMKRKNVFNDFIDSAEHLVREGYTRPERLIAEGGSFGGMVMGVVANERPELFHAVLASVPQADLVHEITDPTLPMVTYEYLESGDPKQKAAFEYMKSYSPYDNIKRQAYPAMLVTAGFKDTQAQYWPAAKYVARLRAHKTDSRPLLLKTDFTSGHYGASGRYDAIGGTAFELAWMLSQWGINE
ncbi:S9 family peptidase [Rugamonas aquatica]|uniref:Prolyl oligopeptidase family serine peptidase n=1 Tax=Rugamonas aquatica TaxID=2743357 RepID=A0A6A7MZF3_9BURK|nr:S9 family peptidase [Rugamonas aquatica]MQA38117.1 prolyl oligopeptidase family serine peptidase [Rugamonas aquatica]